MNKDVIKGFVFGLVIVPIATLGLALRIVEIVVYPLILLPKIAITSIINVQNFPGILSIALLALASGIFYSLIGYMYTTIKQKSSENSALVFLIAGYIVLMILSANSSASAQSTNDDPPEAELRVVPIQIEPIRATTDGDPDDPIVVGQVPNENTGVEPDEIDARASDDDENAMTGIEPDEIDFRDEDDDDDARKGNVETEWKVEEGESMMEEDEETVDVRVWLFDEGQQTRSGYLKIGDIKGESQGKSDKGKIEPVWKIEEGIMVDSRERLIGITEHDRSETFRFGEDCDGVCRAEDATTFERLQEYVARTANSSEAIKEIQVSDEAIEMQGVLPFQLFGFIPLRIRATIEANMNPDAFGRVQVKLPWYRVFGRLAAQPDRLEEELETAIAETETSTWTPTPDEGSADEVPTETLSLNFEEIKAHILDTLSRVFDDK